MLEQGAFRSAAEIPPPPPGYLEKTASLLQSPRISRTHAELLRYFMHDFRGMEWERAVRFPVQVVWGNRDMAYHMSREQEEALQRAGFAVQRIDRAHHFPLSHPVETASLLRMRRDSQQSPPTNAMAADRA